MATFSGKDNYVKIVFFPSEKASTLKGKNLLLREQILSFYSRVLFRGGLVCSKTNMKLQAFSPFKKNGEPSSKRIHPL